MSGSVTSILRNVPSIGKEKKLPMQTSEPEPGKRRSFHLLSRFACFRWAGRGLWLVVRDEPNARVHLTALILVTIAGGLSDLSRSEWLAIVIVSGLVLVTEVLNTALERLVDLVSPEWNAVAGAIKDISAGAVLLASLTAVITGLIIFGPRLLGLMNQSVFHSV